MKSFEIGQKVRLNGPGINASYKDAIVEIVSGKDDDNEYLIRVIEAPHGGSRGASARIHRSKLHYIANTNKEAKQLLHKR